MQHEKFPHHKLAFVAEMMEVTLEFVKKGDNNKPFFLKKIACVF